MITHYIIIIIDTRYCSYPYIGWKYKQIVQFFVA